MWVCWPAAVRQAGRRTWHTSAVWREIKSQWRLDSDTRDHVWMEWQYLLANHITKEEFLGFRSLMSRNGHQATRVFFFPKALLSLAVHHHLHAWLLWHLAPQWSYSSTAGSGSLAKWCDLDQLPLLDGGLEDLLHRELLFQAFAANPGKMHKICDNV